MSDDVMSPEHLRILAHWIEHCPQRCRSAQHAPGGLAGAVRQAYAEAEPQLLVRLALEPGLTLAVAMRALPSLFPPQERTRFPPQERTRA